MPEYFKYHTKWHQIKLNMQLRAIRDHIQHYEDLENFFGFHYWLQDNVATSLNNVNDPIEFASEAFIHTTFQQNFFYCIRCSICARKGSHQFSKDDVKSYFGINSKNVLHVFFSK